MTALDATHAPELRSWVESANVRDSDFPIQNLPLGVFKPRGASAARIGVAIGDRILDLSQCIEHGLFDGVSREVCEACQAGTLNALMRLGRQAAWAVRQRVSELLRSDASSSIRSRVERALARADEVELMMPARIGDYTDFYASIEHATNVGSMFRPDNPLLPNYRWVPIGYHGRSSSIVVSGTDVRRPLGQAREGDASAPVFGPSRRLDYELEVGAFVGQGNRQGDPIPIGDAERHVFGLCIVNDWSARDIQTWEYQPLGPFLAKNFATSISPWVVTLDALAPYRAPARARAEGDPAPLPHLASAADADSGGFDIMLEVLLTTARMREQGLRPVLVSKVNFAAMYWTIAQLVTHHTSNGCNLNAGDLLASGTVSGATKESRGCLLERTWRGTEPLQLPSGETRSFLADGDEVIMRAYCTRDGMRRIGFGECRGRVLPALGAG
ncbi:MAG TPA: fumarylacetoacetase [Gemmatimonadaceae bacterium]|nr:fumarylacetoacetase [Gemmatimonadaceae bacterium]